MRLPVWIFPFFSSVYSQPQVKLGNTTLTGLSIPLLKQEFFGGIPFAQAPVNELRLQPPVLQTSLNVSEFDATKFGPACLQPGLPSNQVSEDCLSINVFRPGGLAANASLPVMAWIYGGGFLTGETSSYNGSGIVLQSESRGTPVIYVNFNYRLGPLGFPQGQEADDKGSLNLGIRDQATALQWIQQNIAAFGGDPSKVTVFGESAGAISIGILFLNSGLDKLVRAAIFESGSAATTNVLPASAREQDWQDFAAAVPECASAAQGNDTFKCLQAANTSEIFNALQVSTGESGESFPWSPVLDGPKGVLPDLPSRLWNAGSFAQSVAFIAGTNQDEGTLFTPQNINSTAGIFAAITSGSSPSLAGKAALNASAQQLLQLYPDIPALGSPYGTGNNTFGLSSQYKRAAAIAGDLNFQSQRRLWIQTASNFSTKTFGYLFSDPNATFPGLLDVAPGSVGICHGSEIPYVYGFPVNVQSAQTLSENMIDYWVSFATSLDPNDGLGSKRPNWPQYTPKNQVLIQLNGMNTTVIPDTYREQQIAFITSNSEVWDQ